jgi:uncharacterized protein
VGSLRSIQGEANRLLSQERREKEEAIRTTRTLDLLYALHGAILHNELSQVTSLLEKNSDLIAATDLAWTFNTALTRAIYMGLREMVKLLLRFADVNHIEKHTGKSPIINAVLSGNPEIVKLLLDAGADPNLKKGRQKSALFHARRMNNGQIVSLLVAAGAKE